MSSFKLVGIIGTMLTGAIWSSLTLAQDPPRNTCADFFLAIDNPATLPCRGNLASIPFDLLAPGARSLGLGGAFAAVADDATAAEANPAGQTILTRPEVSVHVRNASYDARFFDPNALDANLYNAAGPGPIAHYHDSNTKISFLSFVYPFERFVFSAYYQNSGRLQSSSNITSFDAVFGDTYIAATRIDVEQEAFGVSGAFRINDLFSIGASIKQSRLDIQSAASSSVFGFRDLDVEFPGAGPYQDQITLGSAVYGNSNDLTWNAGLLVNPNGKFSGALVYKKGGTYDVTNRLSAFSIASCANAECSDNLDGSVERKQSISLPDILSAGVAWRPTDTWLLSLQVDQIDYGKLPIGSATGFLFGSFQGEIAKIDKPGRKISVHGGGEKTFLFDTPVLGLKLLSVRAGAFTDPDHDGYSALKTGDTHYTLGLGTVVAEHLQVDLGAEWSDRVNAVVMSGVYHF
jgi:hypothetical protein